MLKTVFCGNWGFSFSELFDEQKVGFLSIDMYISMFCGLTRAVFCGRRFRVGL